MMGSLNATHAERVCDLAPETARQGTILLSPTIPSIGSIQITSGHNAALVVTDGDRVCLLSFAPHSYLNLGSRWLRGWKILGTIYLGLQSSGT